MWLKFFLAQVLIFTAGAPIICKSNTDRHTPSWRLVFWVPSRSFSQLSAASTANSSPICPHLILNPKSRLHLILVSGIIKVRMLCRFSLKWASLIERNMHLVILGYAVTNTTVQGTIILETCNKYPEGTYVDPRWKAARAFTVMALIIGGVVTFWALLAQCIYPNKAMYRLGGMIMMVCCLFQGLTLLFLDSEACHNNSLTQVLENELSVATLSFSDTCVMAMGAKCAIAGTVMWFFAALSAFKVEPPKRAPVMVQTQDVTYTKTTNPEGTTVVTETVIKGEPVEVGSAAAAQDTSAADAETPRDAN